MTSRPKMNIADCLSEHARNRGDHPAIEDGDRIIDYRTLDAMVDETAANLSAEDLSPGDVVAVMLPDSADHLILLCALARAGTVMLSLSPAHAREEAARALAAGAAKVVIVDAPAPTFAGVTPILLSRVRRSSDGAFERPDIGDTDPVMLIQSSGTTGAPKSFLRGHQAAVAWMDRYARTQSWSSADRCLCLTNMSFNVGRNIALGMLRLGATVVINRAATHDALVRCVRDQRISYLKLTPSHVVPLLDFAAGKETLFPELRAMVVGSAPTTHEQRLLARQRLTPNFCEQLGSNEAGLLAYATPAEQDAFPDAVGRLADGVEAEIVDASDQPLPVGDVGLVRFRADGYPTEYFDDPEATARAFRDGWFYPGDLAAVNDKGYLFFKGRADDVINNGGAKFYPMEVEAVLLAHPAVSEAAVFAWPHPRLGQVAAACIVTNAPVSRRTLQTFCRKHMAGYKVPQMIAKLAALPKNPMGKVQKGKLKKALEDQKSAGPRPLSDTPA